MSKAAKVRLKQAINYLERHDIDIFSRADLHYRNAIYIATGCELDEIHAKQHKNKIDKDKN